MGRAETKEECARARSPAHVCVSERVGVYPEIKQKGVGRGEEGKGGAVCTWSLWAYPSTR